MNAPQHDDESLGDPIPHDVRESLQRSAPGATVPIGVGKWIGGNPSDDSVHRVAELTTEPGTLPVIPVLSSFQVELGGSTDEDGQVQ